MTLARASWHPRQFVPYRHVPDILRAWREAGSPQPFPLDIRYWKRTGRWSLRRVADAPKPAIKPTLLACGAATRGGGHCKGKPVMDPETGKPNNGRCRMHRGQAKKRSKVTP